MNPHPELVIPVIVGFAAQMVLAWLLGWRKYALGFVVGDLLAVAALVLAIAVMA